MENQNAVDILLHYVFNFRNIALSNLYKIILNKINEAGI